MKAMILAAGRGERLRPLTDETPKPLIRVADKPLIEYHLEALAAAGYTEVVINLCYLGQRIQQHLGSGERFGLKLHYSLENTALETAGGIIKALPLLGQEPFLVLSADIWTDFNFSTLALRPKHLAHLVMVPNPPYHPAGDFCLHQGLLSLQGQPRYTYGNIGVFDPKFFAEHPLQKMPLAHLLKPAIAQQSISAELYKGAWVNVGDSTELALAEQLQRNKNLR